MEKILRKTQLGHYVIFCPGCQEGHGIDGRWTFNGDFEKPTFSPSLLVRGTKPVTEKQMALVMSDEKIEPTPRVCHSFIRDGMMEFLSDSTHELAGKTVPLEAF